jgi:hypothetical protein
VLLNQVETEARLNSPSNLMTRLRLLKNTTKDISLFTGGVVNNSCSNSEPSSPSLPQSAEQVTAELEEQIKDGLIKSTARKVLGDSLELLSIRLPEIDKARDLSRVATDMGRIINDLTPKQEENHNHQQVIIYRPVINQESHYQSVHVSE